MNRSLIMSLLLTCSLMGYSQHTSITGTIYSTVDTVPLPYVNIGIANKAIGTVSNFEGIYRLDLKEGFSEKDSIIYSHVGFSTQKICVSDLLKNTRDIHMEPSLDELDEVIVSVKAPKEKKIGRHSKGLGLMHANFYAYYEEGVDDRLSKEKGMKLKLKGNCLINSLNFNITSNDFSSLKFRINFYNLKDGKPGDLIVHKNIICEIKDQYLGWYNVNLDPYDLFFEEEIKHIAVTIQWIESVKVDEKSKYFSISTASSATDKSFSREKAMDSWTVDGQSFSFYLDALCN